MIVHCWDCKAVWEIPADMESDSYRKGQVKRLRDGDLESPWMGLCDHCKTLHTRAADPTLTIPFRRKNTGPLPEGQTTRRILWLAEEIREGDPALSRETAIHQAVELVFAAEREPDPLFRAYLIARAE